MYVSLTGKPTQRQQLLMPPSFEQVSNPNGQLPILKAELLRDLVKVALLGPEE
jgi:hypothetical protein